MDLAKQSKKQNKYEKIREKFLNEFTNILSGFLQEPNARVFHEIFFFNSISSVKEHIVGSHRAAIHTALNNPHFYLQVREMDLPADLTFMNIFLFT